MNTNNKKKFTSTLVALVLALGIVFGINYVLADFTSPTASFPACDPSTTPACNTPINVGTLPQVKPGGLSVNAFIAYMNSEFKQVVTVDQLSGGDVEKVCSDSTGKLVRCDAAAAALPCPAIKGGYAGTTTAPCTGQIEYYSPGTWVNPAYSGGSSLCTTDSWKSYPGSNVTVTNKGTTSKNYLVIGQAFVGDDNNADS